MAHTGQRLRRGAIRLLPVKWQLEGIAKAKAAGIYKGRPASINVAQVREMKAQGLVGGRHGITGFHVLHGRPPCPSLGNSTFSAAAAPAAVV